MLLKPVIVNRFYGGIAKDGVSSDLSKFALTKHFDAFTYRHKLVPFHATEADETKSYKIVKFLYAPTNAANTTFRLLGLGVVDSTTRPKIFTFDIDAGTPDATEWVEATNGASASGARSEDVFFYYKLYAYCWRTGNLCRWKTDGSEAFDSAYQSISWTNVAEPVHHPADDVSYFFSDNLVHSLNNTTFTSSVLTLPSNMKITAACAYGNYLAIACTTLGAVRKTSTVFLWDRDSSLTTLTERIDCGEGEIKHLASLDGVLTAIVDFYTNNVYALQRPKVLVKHILGGVAKTVNELVLDATMSSADFPATRQVKDGILYFPLRATYNSDTRFGVWAVNSEGAITLAFVEEEATSYQGIFSHGNFWWIAHSADGSVNRSDDNRTFSATNPSIYESLVFDDGDPSATKQLANVAASMDPIPASSSLTFKYRKDEETSWTTIFTTSTANLVRKWAVNIESSGAALPTYARIQFRIESVGVAIRGFRYQSEVIDDQLATP